MINDPACRRAMPELWLCNGTGAQDALLAGHMPKERTALPDELMIDILASVFDSFKDSKGVIFDGFPRTIAQAEALKKMLAERGQEVSVMLDLDVPEEELMKRLIKRGQESGRADDNEETIKKRLVVYHSQTAPLIDWYKQDGKYQHIQGFGVLEEIFADVCKAIDAVK